MPSSGKVEGQVEGEWRLRELSLAVDVALEQSVAALRAPGDADPSAEGQAELPRIAHAGGAVDGRTYANSIAALEHNFALGFRWFELDFQWTADGELVCGHDWGPTLPVELGLASDAPPTLERFRQAVAGRADAPCLLEPLRGWLDAHPDARIVTDFKSRAIDGLRVLAERIPEHGRRLIAQVYQPDEIAQARALGYRDIIWTLYRYAGQTRDVVDALARNRPMAVTPMAVTIDQQRLASGLGLTLQRAGVPVYVHTVNDADTAADYLANWGAAGIYTDTLAPPILERLETAERAGSE